MNNAEVIRKNRQTRRNEKVTVSVGQEVKTMFGTGTVQGFSKDGAGQIHIFVKISEAGKHEFGKTVSVMTLR